MPGCPLPLDLNSVQLIKEVPTVLFITVLVLAILLLVLDPAKHEHPGNTYSRYQKDPKLVDSLSGDFTFMCISDNFKCLLKKDHTLEMTGQELFSDCRFINYICKVV